MKVSITIEYRDGSEFEVAEAKDTIIREGLYVIQHTDLLVSKIPLDRIASITEEVID